MTSESSGEGMGLFGGEEPPRQRSRSRSRSYSRSPSPKLRRFTPSPDRGGDTFSPFFDVPTELKRSSIFINKLLLSGSGDFGIKEYQNFEKFTKFESKTNEIDAGHGGDCLPFGYSSFLDLVRDMVLKVDLSYSIFICTSLNNIWEEAVIQIKEDSVEFLRGRNEENVVAKIYYDDIYALSPLVDANVFNIFYKKDKVIRLMHERYEVGFIVYYALWKLSENGRKYEVVETTNNVDWKNFPLEALSKIFSFAATCSKDMAIFSLVNQRWNEGVQRRDDVLWKRLYELEFNEVAYFKKGVDVNWRDTLKERRRVQKISTYDVLRCNSPSQRDLKISVGISFFDTHIFNCAMFSGKWYYEFVMPETGIDAIQVGVTTMLSKPFYHVGFEYFGVGDDDFSWSYDGVRSQKFHGNTTGGTTNPNWQESYKWQPGDVIRVGMNIDEGELRFLHNHTDLGVAYTFPVNHRITNFDDDEMAKKEPILPYFPAITCQQSTYGGDNKIEIIIQRAKMRYGPPEGYTALGENLEEKQYVSKICLTHIGEEMTTLVISRQLTKFVDELKQKGLIDVPPPIENVNVDAGENAIKQGNKPQTTSYNDYGYDNLW